ncbi:uncharacterized protein LOC143425470 [Xylocopa sonorina]|uniref:uncharacterized protein LOC143425470 n=1 Tax=Xylocopa sonorina TaxID=1818115 RepID=UPI00403ADDED
MPVTNKIGKPNDNNGSRKGKLRNKAMRDNRGKFNNKHKNLKSQKLWKIKLIKHLINDLKNYGPTNLVHINVLSTIIGKGIRIWTSKGRLYRTINVQTHKNDPIDIQYHKQPSNDVGHFTLMGNNDPTNVEYDLNACLFAVIAAQIGKSTNDVRADTIRFINNNRKRMIDQINQLSADYVNGTSLMIGGARYVGTSPRDAAIILNNSQDVLCYNCRERGHPRGHASDKNAQGRTDSVENYSRSTNSRKSGFLSRYDQDKVAHIALKHDMAQDAMRRLNNGATSEALTLSRRDLKTNSYKIPKMKEYYNGQELSGELDINRVTLVLRHHQDKYRDPEADVFVHTIYPRSS